jgi:hypothetical protein
MVYNAVSRLLRGGTFAMSTDKGASGSPKDYGAGRNSGLPEARVADSDREHALSVIQQACVDGRLTLEELGHRVEVIERASTTAELWTVTSDVAPVAPSRPSPPLSTLAIMSEVSRVGRWRVGEQSTAIVVMGKCMLDLRRAAISSHVTTIRARILMGELEILVPEGVEVDVETVTIMGSRVVKGLRELPSPDAPVVRVTGIAMMGAVNVRVMS